MLCLSGFELYSRWVPLTLNFIIKLILHVLLEIQLPSVGNLEAIFLSLSL